MKSAERKRIAWFSPLNTGAEPSSSVSAYCSDELLPLLRERYDIELFHAGFDPYRDYPTFHYLSAFSRHRRNPYDFFFYQLEDAKNCNFIRVHLGLMPGVVWFHDFIFSTFGPEPILNSPWRYVVDRFNNPAAAWPERGAELDQVGPLGFREGAWAVTAMFSNPVALAEYRRNITSKLQKSESPGESGFFVPTPASSRPRERTRSDAFRIAYCGSPQLEDRAHKLLLALRELRTPYRLQWMIEEAEQPHAQSLLQEFEISSCDLLPGRTPQRWRELSSTIDCAVHTFFSVYGQPDPYLAISLMAGIPSIVTRFGSTEYLPENIVLKVDAGDHEATQIEAALKGLSQCASVTETERIRRFALDLYASEQVARELSAAFDRSAQKLSRFGAAWHSFEERALRDLINEAPSYMADPADWDRLAKPVFEEFGWK